MDTTIFVSTDKACNPINTYGMTKAISEQLMIEKAYYITDKKFVNVRYGNVLNSSGSIIPLLHNIGKSDKHDSFSLTHEDMTRFVMTLSQSVDLIEYAIFHGTSGDTIIPNLISLRVKDLIELFSEKYNKPIKICGLRPGEKMLECLVNFTQSGRVCKINQYYHIRSIFAYKETILADELKEYTSKINPLTKKQLHYFLVSKNLI